MPSPRVRVRRRPQRGAYDRRTIDAILDEGLVAHLGFVHRASITRRADRSSSLDPGPVS
jgi:hypothetical protein